MVYSLKLTLLSFLVIGQMNFCLASSDEDVSGEEFLSCTDEMRQEANYSKGEAFAYCKQNLGVQRLAIVPTISPINNLNVSGVQTGSGAR